jgi:hypothetical protein
MVKDRLEGLAWLGKQVQEADRGLLAESSRRWWSR